MGGVLTCVWLLVAGCGGLTEVALDQARTESEVAGPAPASAEIVGTFQATRVADGDTVVAVASSGPASGRSDRVRLAIVDTPEAGECGFARASAFTRSWLDDRDDRFVLRRPDQAPRRDPNGRLLGEVLGPAGDDGRRPSLNVALVAAGVARIDDQYGAEDPDLLARLRTVRDGADVTGCASRAEQLRSPRSDPGEMTYGDCDQARAAGVAPLLAGEPGYSRGMDGDGDGIACE